MRKTTLAGAIALSLLSLNVHALSVGNMQVASNLGEPLDISIDLNSIDENEYSTLEVKLATREMFKLAGIEYPRNGGRLQVSLGEYKDGKAQISVKTAGAVSDPFVHLLLSINWSGGNILREYTALIDPADYQPEPLAQATSPATSLGMSKPMEKQALPAGEDRFHTVKNGDSLSAIAALYRPSDVSIQQAWMAFFNLNREAFSDGNLNYIKRGARLRVPSDAQLRAMSQDKALQEVRRLARPLKGGSKPVVEKDRKPSGPTLVVGGSGGGAPAPKTAEPAAANPAATGEMQLSDLQGYEQLASIVTELGDFTQTIRQEITSSRDRDALLKEELIATRGENRVLTERMARLEAQIAKMGELLELQGNALQSMSQGGQAPAPGLALDQLEPAAAPAPALQPEVVVEQPVVAAQPETPPAAATAASEEGAEPRSYYEQLLDEAISDAPQEDLSYIEEVLGQSSTSIGLQDTNPVTPEMQARAAAARPAAPAGSADQETAQMLANVRASLGNLSGATGGADAPKLDVEIAEQDIAYLDALNEEDRSQIQKSEARIAQLEEELQARIRAAQGQAAAPAAPAEPKAAPEPAAAIEQPSEPAPKPEAANDKPAPESQPTRVTQDTGLMETLTGQLKDIGQSVSDGLGGVTSDVWRLLGGLGAAVIGLMVILGLRRRKAEPESETPQPDSVSIPFVDDESEEDVADLATKSMQQEPEENIEEEEMHGSSLFDLSDESFMASEAIQDDSSLFSMEDNEDMDSLTEMDSAQLDGGQSTMTQSVDVDPIAEADVYLAYDRKEQAIEVLEQALSREPNQSAVVIKLLSLYQESENIEGFTRLFESSAEHIEDDNDWNKIKMMAQEFVPGHEMLADDFDSSIPVLNDEVVADTQPIPDEPEDESEARSGGLELAGDDVGLAPLAAGDDIADDAIADDESLNLVLSEDETANIELEEEIDTAVEEVNQHEPDTALALAKAYIELGESDIARDFLLDVINGGSEDLKAEAEEMLAALG